MNKGAIATFPTGNTSETLFNFVSPDGSILPHGTIDGYFDTTQEGYQYPQDQYTFMLIAAHGTTAGKDSRMIRFFTLDPDATETELALTDDSMVLNFTTNLATMMPVPVPTGLPNLVVDWENMYENALGNEFVLTKITEVMVAQYVGQSRAQLDADFLNLRETPAQKWTGEVEEGFSMDLSTLTDDTGAAFTGIDTTGVWLVALFCDSCNNPAPWAIIVLQPC